MKYIFLLLIFACSKDPFPKASRLDRLRVVAVIADTPEINETGGNVDISLLVSDTKGGTRNIDVEWKSCLDPGVVYGKDPDCDSSATSITGITLASQNRTEVLNNLFTVTVPPNLISAFSPKEQFNGINYLVVIKIIAGVDSFSVFRRIKVSNKSGADLNTNPTLKGIEFDGGLPTFPENKSVVTPSIGMGAEAYEYIDGNNDQVNDEEDIYLNWYTTSGEFLPSVTEIGQKTKLGIKSSDTDITVIGIIRDGRGGIGFYLQEF